MQHVSNNRLMLWKVALLIIKCFRDSACFTMVREMHWMAPVVQKTHSFSIWSIMARTTNANQPLHSLLNTLYRHSLRYTYRPNGRRHSRNTLKNNLTLLLIILLSFSTRVIQQVLCLNLHLFLIVCVTAIEIEHLERNYCLYLKNCQIEVSLTTLHLTAVDSSNSSLLRLRHLWDLTIPLVLHLTDQCPVVNPATERPNRWNYSVYVDQRSTQTLSRSSSMRLLAVQISSDTDLLLTRGDVFKKYSIE